MGLLVQDKYKYLLEPTSDFSKSALNLTILVGDSEFLIQELSKQKKLNSIQTQSFLLSESAVLSVDLVSQINPARIFHIQSVHWHNSQLIEALQFGQTQFEQALQIDNIKASAEIKRSELERLNLFLKNQSDEKKAVLGEFHTEELNRKNKEKKLISFLDYLNTEYHKSDFVLDVLQTFWSDLKKIGAFYRIGFVMQNQNYQSYVVEFDGKIDRTKNMQLSESLQQDVLNQFLANLYKRPVGKLQIFAIHRPDSRFLFYLETQGHEFDLLELDRYMSDRMSLLSIVVQRWHFETTKIQILKQWQQLFKSYQNPIHVIDKDYNLIQSNYGAEAAEGVSKCHQILAKSDTPCTDCPLRSANNGQLKKFIQFQSTDYHVVSSEFMVDQKTYFFMIYENATEVNLLKSNLIQAEKMATIGQLSNHLAHELNNPLTGLKLYAEMLLSENQLPSATFENDMREVLKAISRSQTILNDLNQFANESQTQLVQVDFSEIVKKTMTLLKSVLRTHRVFIDLKPAQIWAQPTYLQQILFNLIKNSCQSMADKGTLKIYQIDNFDKIDFVVEDDGPGLPEQIAHQIFKPFFTTKEAGQGTGLGLFISQKLMGRMNAELIYNSKFTKGAQFILRFKK